MYCHECGSQLEEQAVFCNKCGAKIINEAIKETEPVITMADEKAREEAEGIESVTEVEGAVEAEKVTEIVTEIVEEEAVTVEVEESAVEAEVVEKVARAEVITDMPIVSMEATPQVVHKQVEHNAQQNLRADNKIDKVNKPMKIMDWIITFFVMGIPLLNIVMFFVWGFGAEANKSRKTYLQASLILAVIAVILMVIFGTAILTIISIVSDNAGTFY